MRPLPVYAALGLLLAGLGCRSVSQPASSRAAADIPDRPEQLTFDPLHYEPPDPAEFRVQLESGPVAYVASDRELPLVNIRLLIRAGNYLDPPGKEGLGVLTGYLLSKGGTKSMTAEELEERLAFLAAHFSTGLGDTRATANLNLLSKDLDEGLAILREALTEPRFQEDQLELTRTRLLQAMRTRNDSSADIEARERGFLAYGEDFWSNQYETESSLNSIQRRDLIAFHQEWFHPSNFVVAASGDFDRDDMIARLETLFANWPHEGTPSPAMPTNIVFADPGLYLVEKDVNQGRVSVMLPGILRTDPDYFPIVLMNRILGGGGFTSRLVNRVRSDEGLAYAAHSQFPGGIWYPQPFVAGFQTKSRTVPYATSIVLEELARMADTSVQPDELETAQQSLIETFPRAFSSKLATVGRFADDEFSGRFEEQPDYYRKYRERVAAVTVEDVQRVAAEHLESRPPTILIVGQLEEILKGHPDHPERLEDLIDGPIVELPLRDPMTMRPLKD